MKSILIFTSQSAMDVNGIDLPWELDDKPVHTIAVTPEKQFLIANDELTDPQFIIAALQEAPVIMLYIMHHRQPKQEVLAILKIALDNLKIPYEYPFFQSEHTDLNTYIKVPCIDKLYKSSQIEQLEMLFDEFIIKLSGDPVLEARLNILHLLLPTETQPVINKNKLDDYIEQAVINEEITLAITAFSKTSNSHFDKLTVLRDQLLSEY